MPSKPKFEPGRPHTVPLVPSAALVTRTAVLSPCGVYRYLLTREWSRDGGTACFIMLNPSTADAEVDDPTIRRCVGFAYGWGCGRLRVVNLFAFRSPYPKDLVKPDDPVGPDNDHHVTKAVIGCTHVVAAWGANVPPRFEPRVAEVLGLVDDMGATLRCFGTTQKGHPSHPLFLLKDTELVRYKPKVPA